MVPEEVRESFLRPDIMRAPRCSSPRSKRASQGSGSWPRTSSAGSRASVPGAANPRADDGARWLGAAGHAASAKIAP